MDESFYLHLYDAKRKINESHGISLNLSLGNTCFDNLLKINDSCVLSSSSTIATIRDHIPSNMDSSDDCISDVVSAKSKSLSLIFYTSGFFSSSTTYRESSLYDKKMLNHIKDMINYSISLTNEALIIQYEASVLLNELKSSKVNFNCDLNLNYNVVYTTLKAQASSCWYFENCCSHHMIGDKSFFTVNDESITFGDINKAMICGKVSINAPRIPEPNDVLYMEGFKENLISISQIYESKYLIKFIHNKCTMYDSLGNIMVKDTKSKNKFYCIGNPLKLCITD